MNYQNLFNNEKKKKELIKQKKGIKNERKSLKKSAFKEDEDKVKINEKIEKESIVKLQNNSKFFSRDIFNVLNEEDFQEDGKKITLVEEEQEPKEKQEINSSDESENDSEDDGAFEDLLNTETQNKIEGRINLF
jgi:hypothetical protein